MNEGKWYFDDEDGTVSVIKDGEALEVCTVCTFDQDGARWIFGEKTKAHAALLTSAPALLEALEKAKQFIENGIELGYIRMPDADTPDSAHKTLPMINAAIAAARGTV